MGSMIVFLGPSLVGIVVTASVPVPQIRRCGVRGRTGIGAADVVDDEDDDSSVAFGWELL